MNTLFIPRGRGKTTELVKESANTGHHMVCINHREARRVWEWAWVQELEIPYPITHDDFLQRRYYGKRITGFLIDDADMLLQSMTNVPIRGITASS